MLEIMKIVFVVCVGLSLTAYGLSRIEWGNNKRKSSITKSHLKKFEGML